MIDCALRALFAQQCAESHGPGSRTWEGDGGCRGQRRGGCSGGSRGQLEMGPVEGLEPARQPPWVLGFDFCPPLGTQITPILDSHASAGWGFRIRNLVSPQKSCVVGWFSAWVTEAHFAPG